MWSRRNTPTPSSNCLSDPTGATLQFDGTVATIRIDRSPGNRFSFGLMVQLQGILIDLANRGDLRGVVLVAGGSDFSFGADLTDPDLAVRMSGGTLGQREVAALGEEIIDRWCGLPVPTAIAARGRCIGAGACFLVGADFRFVAPDLRVQFPEVDRGLHLSWRILPRLGREFGWPLARRLALTGIGVGVEALPAASVQVCTDPEAEAFAFARSQAAKPPLAVRAITEVFRAHDRADREHTHGDVDAFASTASSQDFAEAIGAWFAKRPGNYTGR